jgi:hypothetical protein
MCGNDLEHVICASLIVRLSSSPLISRCGRFTQTAQNLSFPFEQGYIAEIRI